MRRPTDSTAREAAPPPRWLAAVAAALLTSCSSVGYYGQALWGGARVLVQRRPIERVVADPATPKELGRQLRLVLEALDFAAAELGLGAKGSYRSYVELDRRYAVWNVVAAPELAVEPLTWCFPVAGCVSYRGYFRQQRAERFAARLRSRGFDVEVGGVVAYSTLGRFRDPVLSTFVHASEARLVGLLFHELAHERVWAKGDTVFNESFATVVELEGLDRWLEARGRGAEIDAVRERMRREDRIVELILDYRGRLASAYAEERPAEWRRERKRQLLEELRRDYRELAAAGGGTPGYDAWFARELNNANLASIGAYHRLVPALRQRLEATNGDLEAFYDELEGLVQLPAAAREARLARPG